MDLCEHAEFSGLRREARFSARGLPLTLHRPAKTARGTVVLVPGWSGPRSGPAEILVFLADELARAGWLAVRFDLPGRGDAAGEFSACDLDTMIACAAQTAQETAAAGPAVLLGMCSGGNVALGAASGALSACTHAIALSTLPYQPARSADYEWRRRWRNVKQYAARAFSLSSWKRLARGEINLGRVRKNVLAAEKPAAGARNPKDSRRDIEKELLNWRGRALFVWGGGDEEAAPARAHFQKLHAQGMSGPGGAVFHTVPGANHNFYGQAWRAELTRVVLAFLERP